MNSTYLSHFSFNEMEVAWRHQVVQEHTAFPQSHTTISWSQTSHNLDENLKIYRTLSRRFRCSATEFRFTLTWTHILETVAYRAPGLDPHLSLVSIPDITLTLPSHYIIYSLPPPLPPCPPLVLQIQIQICNNNTNICNITIHQFIPHSPLPSSKSVLH